MSKWTAIFSIWGFPNVEKVLSNLAFGGLWRKDWEGKWNCWLSDWSCHPWFPSSLSKCNQYCSPRMSLNLKMVWRLMIVKAHKSHGLLRHQGRVCGTRRKTLGDRIQGRERVRGMWSQGGLHPTHEINLNLSSTSQSLQNCQLYHWAGHGRLLWLIVFPTSNW